MKPLLTTGICVVLINTAASLTYQKAANVIRDINILDNSQYKNYNNLSLQTIPLDTPTRTRGLLLSYNVFSSLSDQFWISDCDVNNNSALCCRFPNMSLIDLSDNQIQNISSHSLSGMELLKFIFLANNKLKSIPYNIFVKNRLLRFISFSGNRIRYIEPLTFQNLSHLKAIFLERNMITAIHCDTFRGLGNLYILYIHKNHITKLSSVLLRDTIQLKFLKIGNNHLTNIAELLVNQLKYLFHFDASHNHLEYLSATFFSHSSKLNEVDLSYNSIRILPKFVFMNFLIMTKVNLSFNHLETVYLSRIPVSFYVNNNTSVLHRDTGLCTGTVGDVPCFFEFNSGPDLIFHRLNFSFNNISKIFFSKNKESHTMELLKLSFAGNPRLELPVSFVKQEMYIIHLNLDKTNVNWMNITLINEIMELPHLKLLSIVGCPACEHFMKQLLFSVFNYDLRTSIECDEEYISGKDETHSVTTSVVENSSEEDSQSVVYDQHTCHDISEEKSFINSSHPLSYYPCHIFETETLIKEIIVQQNIDFSCKVTIDCSFLSHLVLPIMYPTTSCVLLSYSSIDELEPNYFLPLHGLGYLDLSFNSISYLHDGMFITLRLLKILKLNNNYLVYFNSSAFNGLSSLSVLTLHGNKISSYEPDTLAPLLQLEIFSIDFWNLTELHDETFKNQHLLVTLEMKEAMDLAHSKTFLNDRHFKSLTHLQTCTTTGFAVNSTIIGTLFNTDYLQNLTLVEGVIPLLRGEAFHVVKTIERMVLSGNKIEFLDTYVFKSLNQLVYLDLSNNQISSIYVFKSLNQLVYLDLSNNQISSLDTHIFNDTLQLKHLILKYNQIPCIPLQLFDSLTNLVYLDLSFNVIVKLDWRAFSKILSIQELNLSGNLIGMSKYVENVHSYLLMHPWNMSNMSSQGGIECPDEIISSVITINKSSSVLNVYITSKSHLKTLTLQKNYIRTITSNTFADSPFLRNIILSHNNINEISDEAFTNTPALRVLDLFNNSLSVIKRNLFQNLTQLFWLDLRVNKIELIEEGAFRDLHSLAILHLASNKLKIFDFNVFMEPNKLYFVNMSDNCLTSLNLTHDLLSLKMVYLDNNPLTNEVTQVFQHMPSLIALFISNISLCEFPRNIFHNLDKLDVLILADICLRGLSPWHFSHLKRLLILDMSLPGTDENVQNTHLDWKNITLIDYWFQMPRLDYLFLSGNPICDGVQRIQILENIFLSEKRVQMICSPQWVLPNFMVSQDGKRAFGYTLNLNSQNLYALDKK